jgi:hypothetical protein
MPKQSKGCDGREWAGVALFKYDKLTNGVTTDGNGNFEIRVTDYLLR